jgi:pimeloyl-ACP methyl ester carboxylesterase
MTSMAGLLAGFLGVLSPALAASEASPLRTTDADAVCCEGTGDYLVLVHGLSWFHDPIPTTTDFFARQGYFVVTLRYEARKVDAVADAVDVLRRAVARHCSDPKRRIHFLGHSLGAIIIRQFLDESPPPRLGRVVLMACPNRGTTLADLLQKVPSLKHIFGGAAAQLGTRGDCVPFTLGSPRYAPGVIMGGRSMFPFLSPFVPGRDDGVVAVDSGRIDGMADFLVLPTTHTYLPRCENALFQAHCFFQTGHFLIESTSQRSDRRSTSGPAVKTVARSGPTHA